jgi:hypothetical protein
MKKKQQKKKRQQKKKEDEMKYKHRHATNEGGWS